MLTQPLGLPIIFHESAVSERSYTIPVVLLGLYFFVEYPKPTFLESFHPALILQSVFGLALLSNYPKAIAVLKEKHFVLYLLLLVEMVIHVPIAVNNFWAFHILKAIFTYLIFSVSFAVFVDDLEKLKTLVLVLILNLTLCAVDELVAKGAYFGTSGYMADTNDFAMTMNVITPIAFYMGLSHHGVKRALYWVTAVIFVAANISSLSRGGFIAMVVVGLLCWINLRYKIRSLMLLILLVLTFIVVVPEEYKAEMLTIQEEGMETGTGRERIELWKVAWRVFLDNPLIGVGQGNVPRVLGDYQDWDGYWQRGITGMVVHSIYLTILPELGIVGATLIVLIVIDLLSKSRQVSRAASIQDSALSQRDRSDLRHVMLGLTIGLVGYLVSGFFLSVFYFPHFWNISGLMIAAYRISMNSRCQHPSLMLGSALA